MALTKEEQDFIEQQQAELNLLQAQQKQGQANQIQQAITMDEQQVGMVKEQLDLAEELETIANLLRGNILKADEHGILKWMKPTTPNMIILSEFGVNLIMHRVQFYLNKNTLLSNYDEETILNKMEDFSISLADEIFMKYEKVFRYPTPEEVQDELTARIDKQVQNLVYNCELQGKDYNKDQLKIQVISEMDIDKERIKTKEGMVKEKLKSFEGLLRNVQDAVHSTYLRAYKGMERSSLRKHMHISETKGGAMMMQQPSKLNPLNWIGRR